MNECIKDRGQRVRIGSRYSESIQLSTGAPQGCVISPTLFTLFTSDCKSSNQHTMIVKFADDTTLVGLIKNDDESHYRQQTADLMSWCQQNSLVLNVNKTKEVIIDFRRKKNPKENLELSGENVEIVQSYKLLGITISDDLKWQMNNERTLKKARQRLFFLRNLKSFGVRREILLNFYCAIIESVLTYGIIVWFGNSTVADIDRLNSVIKSAARIVGCQLSRMDEIYMKRLLNKAKRIVEDNSHPGTNYLELLPSGRRYRTFKGSSRFLKSMFPMMVKSLNKN